MHTSTLTILTDEGTEYEVPREGCHLGAGFQSRQLALQPTFPKAKFALNHRLKNLAPVHICFYYHSFMNRWILVDHSPDPMGTLLALKTGVAYPVSEGLRIKMGPITLEVCSDAEVARHDTQMQMPGHMARRDTYGEEEDDDDDNAANFRCN
jgi:hypothetical protein